jgi:hypothetical protein
VFGPRHFLAGEDEAAYYELLARIRATVMPADIIDEIFITDVVELEWEVLRWRRLKSSLMQTCGREALLAFLTENLDYDLYLDRFAHDLA